MTTRLLALLLCCVGMGCHHRPIVVRPMSPEARREIEQALREMQAATAHVVFAPSARDVRQE